MLMLLISSFGVAVSFNLFFYVTREVSGERLINLFTDTAAILNEFDLRSIIGCPCKVHEHISFVFSSASRDIFS